MREEVSTRALFSPKATTSQVDTILNQESITRKQGEVDAIRLTLHEANRAKNKKELIKRLGHIQHLAKQKNYAEIEKLLQASYV